MKEFKKLNELNKEDQIQSKIFNYLSNLVDINTFDENDSFDFMFGGNVYLVEEDFDLTQVKTMHYFPRGDQREGRYFDVTEVVFQADVLEEIPGLIVYGLFTNNGGGNTYFIPIEIANRYPTIKESLIEGS